MTPTFRVSHLAHVRACCGILLEDRFAYGGAKVRFRAGRGSYRRVSIGGDVTALFMAACRSLGIAARFVSGYQAEADTPDGRRQLHAWPEAFLPGVGWCGFDPDARPRRD